MKYAMTPFGWGNKSRRHNPVVSAVEASHE